MVKLVVQPASTMATDIVMIIGVVVTPIFRGVLLTMGIDLAMHQLSIGGVMEILLAGEGINTEIGLTQVEGWQGAESMQTCYTKQCKQWWWQ
jgi:hypothetical protein